MERREVVVRVEDAALEGTLSIPTDAVGVVAFAHGSGSSRHSPRNVAVARRLEEGGLGTLLIDLLTADEEAIDRRTRHLRFDIGLLARRMIAVVDFLAADPATRGLGIGLFGSSTGAAAALIAAAERPNRVMAVVSRGGRPDLAGPPLRRVTAPTLLLVGERDPQVLSLNRQVAPLLGDGVRLVVVPGATHLFEEPGALDRVVDAARDWFQRWLAPAAAGA